MSPRRLIGCLLVPAGLVAALAPFFFPPPDDAPFLGLLRQDEAPGDWTSHGWLYDDGGSYAYQIDQTVRTDADGGVTAFEATLHVTDHSGRISTYRRTRYFDEYGYTAETVEESPTRTIQKGRGRSGKEPYREVVLSDNSPLLTRPPVRWACHAAGGAVAVGGLALLLWPRRGRRPSAARLDRPHRSGPAGVGGAAVATGGGRPVEDHFLARARASIGRWHVGTGVLWLLYGGVQVAAPFVPGLGNGWRDPVLVVAAVLGGLLAACGLLVCLRAVWAAFAGTAVGALICLMALLLALPALDGAGSAGYGLIMLVMALPAVVFTTGLIFCFKQFDYRRMLARPFVAVAPAAQCGDAPPDAVCFACPLCGTPIVAERLTAEDLAACPVCNSGFSGGAALGGPGDHRGPGVRIVCEQTTRTELTQGPNAARTYTDTVLRRAWAAPVRGPGNAGPCPYCGHTVELGPVPDPRRPEPGVLDVVGDAPPRAVRFPALITHERGAWDVKKVTFRIIHRVALGPEAGAPAAPHRPPQPAPTPAAAPGADGFIRFECPKCGKSVKAGAAQAGSRVRCPRRTCGCVLKVPGAGG